MKNRLVALDVVRILAALQVAVFHLAYWSWATGTHTTPAKVLDGVATFPETAFLTAYGQTGVLVFFVISGFVISFSASNLSVRDFARRRLLRLFPTALICATLTLFVAAAIDIFPSAQLPLNWMRSVTFYWSGPYIDGVYWTLPIEVSFYAFVAFAVWSRCALEQAIMAFGMLFTTLITVVFLTGRQLTDIVPISHRLGEVLLLYHGAFFAFGAMLYFIFAHGLTRERLFVSLICGLGCWLFLVDPRQSFVSLAFYIWGSAVLIIIIGTFCEQFLSEYVAGRVLTVAGLASYPFYLLHDIIGTEVMRLMILAHVERYTALVLALLIIAALSVVVVMIIEPPLRRKIASLLSGVATKHQRYQPGDVTAPDELPGKYVEPAPDVLIPPPVSALYRGPVADPVYELPPTSIKLF